MFSNVLFYLQFGFYIVELLENYRFHTFMRRVHLTRSVRLYLLNLWWIAYSNILVAIK